jgi:hypothetical protein
MFPLSAGTFVPGPSLVASVTLTGTAARLTPGPVCFRAGYPYALLFDKQVHV